MIRLNFVVHKFEGTILFCTEMRISGLLIGFSMQENCWRRLSLIKKNKAGGVYGTDLQAFKQFSADPYDFFPNRSSASVAPLFARKK